MYQNKLNYNYRMKPARDLLLSPQCQNIKTYKIGNDQTSNILAISKIYNYILYIKIEIYS